MKRFIHILPSLIVGCSLLVNSMVLSAQSSQATKETATSKPAEGSSNAPSLTQEKRKLKKELAAFDKFQGQWIIDGKWKDGGELWAKNVYSIGMNGNFFEAKTYAKNEHGKEYQRYHTIWRYNADKEKVESYGFTFDGSVTITDSELELTDSGHPLIRSQWRPSPDKPIFKQEVRLIDDESYGWNVWSSDDGKEWKHLMDGVWKKVKKP